MWESGHGGEVTIWCDGRRKRSEHNAGVMQGSTSDSKDDLAAAQHVSS